MQPEGGQAEGGLRFSSNMSYTHGMVVLVTGASGHLGNVVVRRLLERHYGVRVLLRRLDPPALAGLEVEQVQGDLLDPGSLDRACSGAHWIIHCAAAISTMNRDAKLVDAVNRVGTRNLVDAALAAEIQRFVYVSSVEALDLRASDRLICEDGFYPDRCIMAYGRSKASASLEVVAAVSERGLPAVLGIPSGLVGPYDFGSSRTAEMVRRFLGGKLPAYVDGGFDFVDVRDVADGLISAGERGVIGESYLLTGELLSYYEITEILERVSGVRMSRLKAPFWLALPFTYVATAFSVISRKSPLYTPDSLRILQTRPRFNLTKSEAHLGYRPRPIADSLADTVAWVQGRFVGATAEKE